MRLSVACVLVKGNVPYTPNYVERLFAMVRRHLDREFEPVCLTDHAAAQMPKGIRLVRVSLPPQTCGWWAKVQLFNPKHLPSGRVLYLDLDTLVVQALAPIVDYPAPFALVPTAGHYDPPYPYRVVKRFNSSVMVWDAGQGAKIHSAWTPELTHSLHGDQDWIGEVCPKAATMPLAWFPRLSEIIKSPKPNTIPPDAKVILCKVPKNAEAARRYRWVAEAWG